MAPTEGELVWVLIGRTDHPAKLLGQNPNSEGEVLVQWTSNGTTELVPLHSIKSGIEPRVRRQPADDPYRIGSFLSRYDTGTAVYKFFEGHGNHHGAIVGRNDEQYQVRYRDGDEETYGQDEAESLKKIILRAIEETRFGGVQEVVRKKYALRTNVSKGSPLKSIDRSGGDPVPSNIITSLINPPKETVEPDGENSGISRNSKCGGNCNEQKPRSSERSRVFDLIVIPSTSAADTEGTDNRKEGQVRDINTRTDLAQPSAIASMANTKEAIKYGTNTVSIFQNRNHATNWDKQNPGRSKRSRVFGLIVTPTSAADTEGTDHNKEGQVPGGIHTQTNPAAQPRSIACTTNPNEAIKHDLIVTPTSAADTKGTDNDNKEGQVPVGIQTRTDPAQPRVATCTTNPNETVERGRKTVEICQKSNRGDHRDKQKPRRSKRPRASIIFNC